MPALVNAQAVDVLIIGAGPAGLMLATWLSKLKIRTRIVDKRNTKVFSGQADGVQCRTVEVFQSFGFAHRLVKEGAHINEVVFWNPGQDGGIVRTKRTPDNEPGTSRFPHAVLTQGRIERFMLDAIKDHGGVEIERAVLPTSMTLDSTSSTEYPLTVTLRHLSEEEATPTQVGAIPNGVFRSNLLADDEIDAQIKTNGNAGDEETVLAKYVVGCDGARSWVRKQMGLALEGDSADVYWGVMDIVPSTDFPDIRLKCTVHSKAAGSILIVPREKDLVRFYVQLGATERGQRVDRDKITPATILEKAQAILSPYKLDALYTDWWTVYEVGQRLCPTVTKDERIYIAGDAFHTHSPKAGQGMNISMMDTYNLGWKMAGVLKGQLSPDVLKTYQLERHQTAQELINLDYKLSRMFSGKKIEGVVTKDASAEFKEFFIQLERWASGTATHYKPSLLTGEDSALASGLPVGKRFDSVQVVCVADARPWHLGDRLESDGRFRVVIFAGDVTAREQKAKLEKVAAYFDSHDGPLRRYTPENADIDSVIEVLTIMSNPRISVEPNDFPEILWPAKSPFGCRDYLKIYADDDSYVAGHGHAYEKLGVDPRTGCIVVVRPDQYVSLVVSLDQVTEIGSYFDNFMQRA